MPTTGDRSEPQDLPMDLSAARIESGELFRNGRKEVWIRHEDQHYRLRITQSNKLILTK